MVRVRDEDWTAQLANKNAIVIGPGLGQDAQAEEVLRECLEKSTVPVLVDADALNMIATHPEWLKIGENVKILTPHPGEMARLCKVTTAEIQNNRLKYARELAKVHNVWVVLKGNKTVIAAPNGEVWFNTIDSAALSVAGSGRCT